MYDIESFRLREEIVRERKIALVIVAIVGLLIVAIYFASSELINKANKKEEARIKSLSAKEMKFDSIMLIYEHNAKMEELANEMKLSSPIK
ncbi:MAG: hypothetical protein ACD_84C00004G0006 [uncultured bacterium]|nr:MAG: hypothetical protein ACD_84C00004G0006 [uncultured bacterium]